MKNEALRIFLAVAALILTAMLTNPLTSLNSAEPIQRQMTQRTLATEDRKVAGGQSPASAQPANSNKADKKVKSNKGKKKVALIKTVHKANRSFAFFFRR
jgi:hypothetical protein